MNQSGVLRYCYEKVFEILRQEGEQSKLYTIMENTASEHINTPGTALFISVSDFAQIAQDKNGEKVFVEEQMFPAPTFMAFILSIEIRAEQYPDVLEAAGYIVRYFKDNNTFEAGDYNWHDNTSNTVYIEPVIREPCINVTRNRSFSAVITLEYRIEAAINSEKGGTFKRVQKMDLREKPMPQD